MITKIQQDSLITYLTTCKSGCDCHTCKELGGAENMFAIFTSDDFSENKLRKIWQWLKVQYQKNGSCDLLSLNFEDPSAPKLSDITQCHIDRDQVDGKGQHIPLRNQIYV